MYTDFSNKAFHLPELQESVSGPSQCRSVQDDDDDDDDGGIF